MDAELKKAEKKTRLKDEEVKNLIRRSQEGDQGARDLIVEKICALSGRLSSAF